MAVDLKQNMRTGINYLASVIFLLFVAGNTLRAQDSVKVLSLDDCIKIGLDQSAQILRSEDSVKITGAALLASYGRYLPDLNLGSSYGYISGSNLLTTFTPPTLVNDRVSQMNYELTSTVNIFNGFSNYSALKSATLSKSASQYNLRRAQQQIAFDVTQSFLQVILDRRIITYANTNLDASTKREAQLKELTAVGRNAISDLYQQEAETSSDSLFLIQSDDKLKNDIILLLRKIKISETDKYKIGDMIVDTLPFGPDYQNVQDLVNKAMQQRPDVQSSALNVKIGGWNVGTFKGAYYPTLSLEGGLFSNGGYAYHVDVNGVNELGPQESYGSALFGQIYGGIALNLSWHIFDRFYNKSNVQLAEIYEDNAQIQYDDLMVQVSSDIKQAYNDYLAALQQIQTANRGLFAATQAFDVVQGKYNVGAATFVEVSNAQVVLLQAQVSLAEADVDLALQKKIIDYYIGK
jgi:outer membrane protein